MREGEVVREAAQIFEFERLQLPNYVSRLFATLTGTGTIVFTPQRLWSTPLELETEGTDAELDDEDSDSD